jgi:hypothetical protein
MFYPKLHEFLLRSRGFSAGVRTDDAGAARVLMDRIPGAELLDSGAPDRLYSVRSSGSGYLVRAGGRTLARSLSRREALDRVLREIELAAAESAPGEIFIHAGAVGWRSGVIILPGRSFTGKTSLVVELLRRGATYYSDEYAVFDSFGRVHPYARPLRIRSGNRFRTCTARDLGAAVASEPVGACLIVFTKYTPQAAWRARPITPGNALLRLMANAVPVRRRPSETMLSLGSAVLRSRSFCASRGDGERAAAEILQLFDSFQIQGGRIATNYQKS